MTPTNTDLAALREIADTLPLGSALIVRLAADRLGVDTDGWVSIQDTWSIPRGTKVEIRWGFNGPLAYRIIK